MAQPSATISAIAGPGLYNILWVFSNKPASATTFKSILSRVNENTASSSVIETFHTTKDLDDNQITLVILDYNLLPLGKSCFLQFEFLFNDGTLIRSNNLVVTNKAVPQTPILTLGSSVRPEDSGLAIKIGSQYTLSSSSDGYSPITKAICIISKVGGKLETDFEVIDVDIYNYSDWFDVAKNRLVNDTEYEIAIKLVNGIGESQLSNTIVTRPADTPGTISAVYATSLLSDLKRKNQNTIDDRGDICVFWTKPFDYNNLIRQLRPVRKYVIYEQLMKTIMVDGVSSTVPDGEPTTLYLNVPAHAEDANSGAEFELNISETINGNTYQYKHIIPGSNSRIGKCYRYTVLGENMNGNGPSSSFSPNAFSFKNASPQEFELVHESIVDDSTATPYKKYSGKIQLRILEGKLASLNGGIGYPIHSTSYTYPAQNFTVPNDELLLLEIKRESDSLEIFSGLAKFTQIVNSTTVGTGANAVTTYTPTGEYKLSLDNISVGTTKLNDILSFGTKYRFKLYRQNKDPGQNSNSFLSLSTEILRTKFASPNKVVNIMTYALNDDLTPVTHNGLPAIRLLYEQLAPADFMGLDKIPNWTLYYMPFQLSLPVPFFEPHIHDGSITGAREMVISQSQVGSNVANYLRVKVWNHELLEHIFGQETSPAVQETAITHPQAITIANIVKVSATKVKVGFTRQPNANLGGSSSPDIYNRIMMFEDNNTSPVYEILVQHSQYSNYMSPEITLTTGKNYSLFVIAERIYSKLMHNSRSLYRFESAILRNNYYTCNFVVNGTPGAPTQIQLFASDKKVDVYWDPPNDLQGVNADSISYMMYLNKEPDSFPYYTNTPSPVFQEYVALVSGTSSVSITKAFATRAASNNRTNLVDLVNDSEYSFGMKATGYVGGDSLAKTQYSHTNGAGKVLQESVSSVMSLTANSAIPISPVEGVVSNVYTTVVADNVPKPNTVDILAQESQLQITFNKDTVNTPNDVYIDLVENDALGAGEAIVPAFDTRGARGVSGSGLFSLESTPIDSQPVEYKQYKFQRINVAGVFKYQLVIPGLVNGRQYRVNIRYIRYSNGLDVFSDVVSLVKAPEAPPTAPLNPSFMVDSNKISVLYSSPTNTGGASVGLNGPIQYRITLSSSSDAVLATYDTSQLSYTIQTGLTNGSDYKVLIAAFYIKATDGSAVIGSSIHANTVSPNLIRPNPAPTGPTLSVVVGATNTIGGSITLPASSEMNIYPINRYDVYVRQKSEPTKKALVQSFAAAPGTHPSGLNLTVNALAASSTVNFSQISMFNTTYATTGFNHVKPLNGYLYELVVETIVTYKFAQAAQEKVAEATPYGSVNIKDAVIKSGSNGKTYTVTVNSNGTGPINNVIALAKPIGTTAMLVQNLSGGALPNITVLGNLDNSNDFVAANQISTFDLAFPGATGSVTDLLTVVVTERGSDTHIVPVIGNGFFRQ